VKEKTLPSTVQATAVPHADASGALPAAITLTANDYAQILQLQLADQHIVANVMITPVSNGAVVEAYRMRVDTTNGAPAIGPEGIYFTFFSKGPGGWRPLDGHYMPAGSPVPEAAAQYVQVPAIVTAPITPPSLPNLKHRCQGRTTRPSASSTRRPHSTRTRTNLATSFTTCAS
jgi:hypothetical protein